MAGTLTIAFNGNAVDSESITVRINNGSYNSDLTETFRAIRKAVREVAISADPTEQAANFAIAWNLDMANYGGVGNMSAVGFADSVIISLINPSWSFVEVFGTSITNGSTLVESLTNNPLENPRTLNFVNFTEYPTDPCGFVYANYTATGGGETFNVYLGGTLNQSGITSPFSVLVPRRRYSIELYDSIDSSVIGTDSKAAPAKIIPNNISLEVKNQSTGTTITVTVVASIYALPLQYSLTNNGADWQSENVFTGLTPATYTVYVKDALGCVTASSELSIDGVTSLTETIFSLSDINALRFSKIENGKKNHRNTLSCREVKQLHYPYFHRFLDSDIIPTQFKTNAQYINIYTLDANGNTNALNALAYTENIGLQAKSTCTLFNLGNGRSAIYFGVVDMLDFLSETVTEQVDFGFSTPEWANKAGNFVFINGIGELEIDKIGYSDFYDAFIVELNYSYTGIATEKILSATYNLQPYEVYEFLTHMNAEQGFFNIVIEAGTSPENIEFSYVSERVKKIIDSDKLIEIDYSDPKNKGGMVYQTGIKHKLRLEGYWDYVGEQKTEGYDGDSDYFITDNTVYDVQKFTFVRLSSEMAHKLRLVVAHDTLKVNGIFYKLAESPEITTNPNNNYKTFSVTLKRSGDLFLTDEQELISNSAENDSITAGIEASQGKAMILWTKNNG